MMIEAMAQTAGVIGIKSVEAPRSRARFISHHRQVQIPQSP
jgi:hypothetical protein